MIFLLNHIYLQACRIFISAYASQIILFYFGLDSINLNMRWCLTPYASYVALHTQTDSCWVKMWSVFWLPWPRLSNSVGVCSVLWLPWSSLGTLAADVFRSSALLVFSWAVGKGGVLFFDIFGPVLGFGWGCLRFFGSLGFLLEC